jgi:hypothetical protein
MSKLISQLPEDIKVVAFQRKINNCDELSGAFIWADTPEKYDIWYDVENDNYEPFRAFHAKKQPKNNGWISLSERLPKNEDDVLVIDRNGKISTASFVGGIWFDYNNEFHEESDSITHWQPLPEPPKN